MDRKKRARKIKLKCLTEFSIFCDWGIDDITLPARNEPMAGENPILNEIYESSIAVPIAEN